VRAGVVCRNSLSSASRVLGCVLGRELAGVRDLDHGRVGVAELERGDHVLGQQCGVPHPDCKHRRQASQRDDGVHRRKAGLRALKDLPGDAMTPRAYVGVGKGLEYARIQVGVAISGRATCCRSIINWSMV